MNNIVGIIPARSGSKRLPKKNWRLLNGKPLIEYTIEQAILSDVFDTIIVTTDSDEIKAICQKYKQVKVIERIESLCQDDTTTEDVIFNVMNEIDRHNYIMILQPTSPLRTYEDIIKCVGKYNVISRNEKTGKINGAIYYFNWNYLYTNVKINSKDFNDYYMSEKKSIDIDTYEDFIKCEQYLKGIK